MKQSNAKVSSRSAADSKHGVRQQQKVDNTIAAIDILGDLLIIIIIILLLLLFFFYTPGSKDPRG